MKIPISDRLLACAEFVKKGDRIADIGCDHGYLSIYLLTQGIAASAIASDINKGPLESARRNAAKYGVEEKMHFYLSDGVQSIPREFDTLICAGMGADTIISILSSATWLQNNRYTLILQCQSKTPSLRKYLSENGWQIAKETALRDGRFLYTVMEVCYQPEHPRLTAAQCYLSPALLNDPSKDVPAYCKWVISGLRLSAEHQNDPEKLAVLKELDNLEIYKRRGTSTMCIRRNKSMTTVNDILQFMEQVAPCELKMEWDKIGLNCGRGSRPVHRVLVALDPFEHVCREAKAWGADLLVTHHALIWNSGFITENATWSRNTLFLIENGIAHINAHTNYDCAPEGVNYVLAQTLGLENITVVDSMGGQLLRCGEVKEQTLTQWMDTVKERLGCATLKYVDGGKPVRKVAVGGGACAGGAEDAIKAGCDTFVTSDIGYNRFWDAHDAGLNMIDAGHFHTENPSMLVLVEKLRAAFPEIEVKISETHSDCAKFY